MSRATLIRWGEIVGAITALCLFVGGILTFFNADLPPFSSMLRAQSLEKRLEDQASVQKKSVEDIHRDQTVMTRALLRLDRAYWENQLESAEEDLAKNPNSQAARTAARDAKAQIDYIDEQLKPSRSSP